MAKKRRAKIQKDSPDLTKARSSWERGRYDEALHRFEKAIRRQPNHPMALIDAARAFGARFQPSKAERILKRLEKICAGQPDELVEAAQAYVISNRPAEAIRCLEKVLARHPDHATANREIASLYAGRREFDPAKEHIDRAIAADPDSQETQLAQAQINMAMGDHDFAYAILVDLGQPGKKPLLRAEALSVLAQLQEREGDYAEAYETMMSGNGALERLAGSTREGAEALEPVLAHLRDCVKTTHLKKWAKLKQQPEEDALPLTMLSGPHRAGGTLFSRMLAAHPGIAVSEDVPVLADEIFPAALNSSPEKPNSKSSELFATMTQAFRQKYSLRYRERLLDNHHEHSGDAEPPEHLIDRSLSIAALVPTFLRLVPGGKIIVPVRDPRDVLVSALFSFIPVNRHTVAYLHPFDAAEKIAFEFETWVTFRKLLMPAQWIEVRYEEVIKDFANEARRACRHIGAEWDDAVLDYREANQQMPAGGSMVGEWLQPLHEHSIGRWKHYQEQLGSHFEELANAIELLGYGTEESE